MQTVRDAGERIRGSSAASAAGKVWRSRIAGSVLHAVVPFAGLYVALEVLLRNNRPPYGVFLFGGVVGVLYAFGAFGLILVHRANKIINFANAEVGAASAVLAVLLIKSRFHLPYVLALLLAL